MTGPFLLVIIGGLVCLVVLALIGKGWSAQSGQVRLEIARIEATRRDKDREEEFSMALREIEDAVKIAKDAKELCGRFDSRLHACEQRARR